MAATDVVTGSLANEDFLDEHPLNLGVSVRAAIGDDHEAVVGVSDVEWTTQLVPIPPLVAPSLLFPSEPTGDGGDLAPFVASEPLRLSLTSTIFSVAGEFPQCQTREDASGNSTHGFPIQRYQFLRLGPHLVLHTFSSAGCPIDGGLGGGITYTVPVRPSLWLVASGGYYGIPGRGPALPARTAAKGRVDPVKETKAGSALRIGIEHKSGTGMQGVPAMVTFGSGF